MTESHTPGTGSARLTDGQACFLIYAGWKLRDLFGSLKLDEERYFNEGIIVLSDPTGTLRFMLDGYILKVERGFNNVTHAIEFDLDPEVGIDDGAVRQIMEWLDRRMEEETLILFGFCNMFLGRAILDLMAPDINTYRIRHALPRVVNPAPTVVSSVFLVPQSAADLRRMRARREMRG